MIISHKHKYIFIKTKKTAGTSIEIALSKYCGEEDIISPLPPEDEKVRKSLNGKSPQNTGIPFSKYSLKDLIKFFTKGKKAAFYNHIPASKIRSIVDKDIWNSYYKFCFERNPWDKAISLYYWRTKNLEHRPPFSDFLRSSKAHKMSNFKLYSINGKPVCDKIYLYENIDQALKEIAEKLDLPEVPEIPKTKHKTRKDRRDHKLIINDEDRKYIEKICKNEIEFLNYKF